MSMRHGQITDHSLEAAAREYRRWLASVDPESWIATVLRSALKELERARLRLAEQSTPLGTLGERAKWKGRAA